MEIQIQAGSFMDQQALRAPATPASKRQWMRSVPAARIQWGRLTIDELIQTQGDPDSLSALLQERYALTRIQADDEVAGFLDSCSNWF